MKNSRTLRSFFFVLCIILWSGTSISSSQKLGASIVVGLAVVSASVSILTVYLQHLADLKQDARDEFCRLSK